MTEKLPRVILHADNPFKVYFPPISYYCERLKKLNYFHFIKLNERYWQQLNGDQWFTQQTVKACGGDQILYDIENYLKYFDIHSEVVIIAVSHLGPPQLWANPEAASRIGHRSFDPIESINRIRKTVPPGYIPHFALNWKIYTLRNEIIELYNTMKDYHIVTVGFEHLKEVKHTLGFNFHSHINLTHDTVNTVKKREMLGEHILSHYKSEQNGKPLVYLLQAGEIISAWLIARLTDKIQKAFLIDIGRAIDAFTPNRHYAQDNLVFNELVGSIEKQLWLSATGNIQPPRRRTIEKLFI